MDQASRLFVTLEGYAVEGGYDRPFEPATCFAPTIALGRHVGPGDAHLLWNNYPAVLDLVPGLGLDGVRLTVEWSRVEPRRGEVDDDALDQYAEVGAYIRSLGLGLTVVVIDQAWPAWLGMEAWLLPWAVPDVISHARRVVSAFGPNVGVVPFANRDALVGGGFLRATAPPWRRRARVDAAMASRQIDRIEHVLRDDPVVGPSLVSTWATVSLDESPDVLTSRRATEHVGEWYLRSLVRGTGPTSAPRGLLEQRDGAWHVSANAELLRFLR